jgi:hypothetical protein
VLTRAGIFSAVRSHNVARVNKSYRSFGDKFDTVLIDDLITSDLLAAVKGMKRAASVSSSDTEHIPGVDAIIHVASPSSATPNRDVVLEVRACRTPLSANVLIKYFLGCRYWDHAHAGRCARRRRQETRHHGERGITRRDGRLL